MDAGRQPPRLFVLANLQPVLQQDDAGVNDGFLRERRQFKEALGLLLAAETHHPLDAGTIIPASIEDHDLSGRWQMRNVTLNIHLRLLALSRRRQGDDAENART